MAPSASLQSRISAFEALRVETNSNRLSNSKTNGKLQPAVVKPIEEPNFLDTDSTSPTADSLFAIPPIQPVPSSSRPSSPPALGRKSSLIDFSELTPSPQLKHVSINGTGSTTSSTSTSASSTKPQLPPRASPRPPLPPRKPSIASLKAATTSSAPPPLPKRYVSSPVSSPRQPSSPSLLVPSESHTYPPPSPRPPGMQSRHMPSSSTSSFHSVSLSSDGGDTHDGLDGSYDTVSSSTAATSPTTSTEHDWEHDLQPTPKLPQRPWQPQAIPPPVTSSPKPSARRPAPPPPQRRPVRHDSSASITVPRPHHRPAPLPPNARKRYDAVFDRNLPQSSHKGRSSGWRGLSVDLLTNGEKPDFGDETLKEERIDGAIVKRIWSCSNLPRPRLREIWSECDPDGLGSLDRDAFAKGMWQIDEELSRAQQQNPTRSLPLKPISTTYSPRVPPPPLRKPNFALR